MPCVKVVRQGGVTTKVTWESSKPVRIGEEMCLTDMWKASGRGRHSKPSEWKTMAQATGIISEIEKRAGKDGLLGTVVGRTGGTWAHWQVVLAYARQVGKEKAGDVTPRPLAVLSCRWPIPQSRAVSLCCSCLGASRSRSESRRQWLAALSPVSRQASRCHRLL